MDRDQSGLVSLQEFTAFMKWLRGESRPTVHSSNQQPEIAEAVQENHGSSQVRPEIQKLRKTFNIIDKDQSGSISIREFQNYFATLNHPLSLAEIKELFNKMDENKDGRISF
jgi:Ca2+-binding EF-hand superfamily protein